MVGMPGFGGFTFGWVLVLWFCGVVLGVYTGWVSDCGVVYLLDLVVLSSVLVCFVTSDFVLLCCCYLGYFISWFRRLFSL